MTSLVFGNFYFDYYNYRFGLGFRLGLGLGLGLRLGLRVSFLGFIMKCLRVKCAPSLFRYIYNMLKWEFAIIGFFLTFDFLVII